MSELLVASGYDESDSTDIDAVELGLVQFVQLLCGSRTRAQARLELTIHSLFTQCPVIPICPHSLVVRSLLAHYWGAADIQKTPP